MADDSAPGRRRSPLSDEASIVEQKLAAACAAAELIEDGMRVGLGTGTTVAHLLPAIAEREVRELCCVATSPATERAAHELGLPIVGLDTVRELDIAIDGADQVDPEGWLVKGGGGAMTREKIVAAAAVRFVVIVSADKLVDALVPPVPLELLAFGAQHTLRALAPARLRGADGTVSPDGGLIADYLGAVEDPRSLAAMLAAAPGLVEHGLFPPEMVSEVIVGGAGGAVERRSGAKPAVPSR